jgi:hypothetical protein
MQNTAFQDVKPCGQNDNYRRFGEPYFLDLLYPEDGGRKFLRNISNNLSDYTAPTLYKVPCCRWCLEAVELSAHS